MSVTVTIYSVDWAEAERAAAAGDGAGPFFEALDLEPAWLQPVDDSGFEDSGHAAIDLREACDALKGTLDEDAHAALDRLAATLLGEAAAPRELDAAICEEMELAAALSPERASEFAERLARLDAARLGAAFEGAGCPAPQGVLATRERFLGYVDVVARMFGAAAAARRGLLVLTA